MDGLGIVGNKVQRLFEGTSIDEAKVTAKIAEAEAEADSLVPGIRLNVKNGEGPEQRVAIFPTDGKFVLTQIDEAGKALGESRTLTAAQLNAEYSDTKIDSAAAGAASSGSPEVANLSEVVQVIASQIGQKVESELKQLHIKLNEANTQGVSEIEMGTIRQALSRVLEEADFNDTLGLEAN